MSHPTFPYKKTFPGFRTSPAVAKRNPFRPFTRQLVFFAVCVSASLAFCTPGAAQYSGSTSINDSANDFYFPNQQNTAMPYGATTHAAPPAGSYNPAGTFAQPAAAAPQPGGMEEAVSRALPAAAQPVASRSVTPQPVTPQPAPATGYVSPFAAPAAPAASVTPQPASRPTVFTGNDPATAPAVPAPVTPAITPAPAAAPTIFTGEEFPAAAAQPATPVAPAATDAYALPQDIQLFAPENAPQPDPVPASVAPEMPSDLIYSAPAGNVGSRELMAPSQDAHDLPTMEIPMTPNYIQPMTPGTTDMLSSGRVADEELPETINPGGNGVIFHGYDEQPNERPQPTRNVPIIPEPVFEKTNGNQYEGKLVSEIQVVGNKRNTVEKIMQYIFIRPGHTFTAEGLEEDVRRLNRSRLFSNIDPHLLNTSEGVKIIYHVTERGMMRYIIFQGNEKIRVATLEKECGLAVGKPVTTYDVEEARKKLEMFYHMKGHANCVIRTVQGNLSTDPGVIFQIHEGPKFQIWNTKFVGNKIATGARLRTVIQSRPVILWCFQGELMEEVVQSDVRKLEDYYRRLGFFNARISRRVKRLNETGRSEVTFVINEGPQYKIREIKYLGNDNFDATMLLADMRIFEGKPFNKDRLDQSLAKVRRRYGRAGYVFADINCETRFLDEPGEVDLIFQIKEGKTYRIGRVNVLIEGEFPQTQVYTVLNRLSVKPGDLVNVAELKHSETRLGASQLFEVSAENRPKIVYSPPESAMEQQIAKQVGLSVSDPNSGHTTRDSNSSNESTGRSNLGGAGSAAVNGGHSHTVHKVFKRTLMAPAPDFVLGENEEFLDITIYGNTPGATRPQANQAEIHDPVTGEVYRTFALDADEAADVIDEDAHLGGFISVANDDPAYAAAPVPTRASRRGDAYEARYFNDEPEPVMLQPIQSQQPVQQPFQPQPAMVIRGNNPVPPADDYYYAPAPAAETAPVNGYAGQQAYPAPPAMPATTGQRVGGGGMLPPPSPSVNSYDVSPYTQPVGDVPPPGYSISSWHRQSVPITVEATETMTGRMMFQLGVSTDAGLVGSIILDEQNFDITRWPRSWSDMTDSTAFRGAGQRFRIELQPGTDLQRYSVSFEEPYLLNSQIGLGTSAMYYDRYYRHWTETRIGGQISLSRALTYDLRAYFGFRGYSVKMYDLGYPPAQRMLDAEGSSGLYGFSARIVLDRRDNYAFATEGYYFSAEFEQVVGTWSYPRINLQFKKYWLLAERADMSGRHVLSLTSTLAWTGDKTPIYESYFAGGSSTIRGFRFRDASPRENDMAVGGNFMVLASLEYLFPLTADDTIRGVVFCDSGTVEQTIDSWKDRYRVSIGAGLRITMPMLGPAPVALDFAVPLSRSHGDVKEIFSITMGLQR